MEEREVTNRERMLVLATLVLMAFQMWLVSSVGREVPEYNNYNWIDQTKNAVIAVVFMCGVAELIVRHVTIVLATIGSRNPFARGALSVVSISPLLSICGVAIWMSTELSPLALIALGLVLATLLLFGLEVFGRRIRANTEPYSGDASAYDVYAPTIRKVWWIVVAMLAAIVLNVLVIGPSRPFPALTPFALVFIDALVMLGAAAILHTTVFRWMRFVGNDRSANPAPGIVLIGFVSGVICLMLYGFAWTTLWIWLGGAIILVVLTSRAEKMMASVIKAEGERIAQRESEKEAGRQNY